MAEISSEVPIRLMTEVEVAERIGKTVHSVRYLRKMRRITFIPGQPVLFDAVDVEAYIKARDEAIYRKHAPYTPGTPEYKNRIYQEQIRRMEMYFFRRQQELLKK